MEYERNKDNLAKKPVSHNSTKTISVGAKIFGVVGICLSLLVLVAGTSLWQMKNIGGEIENIAERDLPMTSGLIQITIHQLEQAINFERSVRNGLQMAEHPAAKEEFEKSVLVFEQLTGKIEKEFSEISQLAKHATATSVSEEDRREFKAVSDTLAKLEIEHVDYDRLAIEAFKSLHAGDVSHAMSLLPKIEAEEEDLDHGLENVLIKVESFTERAATTAEHHEQAAEKILLALALLALIAGAGMSYVLVRKSVTRPLAQIVDGLDALNRDDMSVEVEVINNDEIGTVAEAYAVFRQNMIKAREIEAEQKRQDELNEAEKVRIQEETIATERKVVTDSFGKALSSLATKNFSYRITDALPEAYQQLKDDFNNTVENLSATIEQIGSASHQILAGTTEINSAADNLASRTEQQAANVEETSAAVSDTTTAMKTSGEKASLARELVAGTKNNAEKSGEVVSKAIEAMGKIEASAEKITNIIAVIDEISFQTNLLALNAGVEAARAGESGKGFAVVATEVRELAQRSANAAKEIKQLINSSSLDVGAGVSLVNETGEALETIVSGVKQINDHISGISDAVNEQATGLAEISQSIDNIDQGTQQNAAVAEESSAASKLLAEEVTRINDMLRAFDTGKGTAKASPEPVNENIKQQPSPARALTKKVAKSLTAGTAANSAAAVDNEDWQDF